MSCRISAYLFKHAKKEMVFHHVTIRLRVSAAANMSTSLFLNQVHVTQYGPFAKQLHLAAEGQDNSMMEGAE